MFSVSGFVRQQAQYGGAGQREFEQRKVLRARLRFGWIHEQIQALVRHEPESI